MKPLNIESPVLGRKEKESLIEKNWPCHHSDFMFPWTREFMGCPPSPPPFFFNLFLTREHVKNRILLNLLDLGVLHIID